MTIALTGNDLTFDQLYKVALHNEAVSLSPQAVARMQASRAVVDHLVAANETAYGINTGFGLLAQTRIPNAQLEQLQRNLLLSHCAGVGDALPDMPIFLKPDFYVPAPLEETYRITWDDFFPAPMKRLLEAPNTNPPGKPTSGRRRDRV